MEGRFYASPHAFITTPCNRNLWFEDESEVERVCDDLWTPDCGQKIVDSESRQFRIRDGNGSCSPWGMLHR